MATSTPMEPQLIKQIRTGDGDYYLAATCDFLGHDIIDTYATKDEISSLSSAMIFRGTLTTGSTLPTAGESYTGDAYKVITAGTYGGVSAKIGDLLVCDGSSWVLIPSGDEIYNVMTGASSSAAGASGLVPTPAKGKQSSFLRGDGTWVVPTNTTYGISGSLSGNTFVATLGATSLGTTATVPAMGAASSSAAGTAGLVPAPAAGKQTSFLRGDGTWVIPTDTKYKAGGTSSVAPAGHTHEVSFTKASGANSGTAVTALTGVRVSSSSSAAPGGHTHSYSKTTGVSLAANTATADGRITYVQSISGTAPSLTGTTNFVTKISGGSGSLEAYDAATNGTKKVSNGTRIPFVTSVTHNAGSPSHTATASTSAGGGTSVTIASVDANGVLTLASAVNSATAHTHNYDKTTSISGSSITPVTHYLAHAHTAASVPSDGKASVGIQNGSYSATTRYLSAAPSNEATTSAANSGTNFDAATAVASDGTAIVAPNGHTHEVSYTGTSGANSGTAVSAVTSVVTA